MTWNIPNNYREFITHWQQNYQQEIARYTNYETTFIPNLLPQIAVQFTSHQVLEILEKRLGSKLQRALDPQYEVESPIAHLTDTAWMKTTNMVGINVRTIRSFWNVIKYILTVPASQQAVHLLPIWEPGVVASLYGMSSWNINPEFFSRELAQAIPVLNTVEKQLKVVVNLLHAMNRVVGMDVIPHTDRYSEIVLANPQYFEWLQRKDMEIVNHTDQLHETVQQLILNFLIAEGGAVPISFPLSKAIFFSDQFPEAQRLKVLFGEPAENMGRLFRRDLLLQWLYDEGFEPVPATMAPPYRGIEVDPNPSAKTIDSQGRVWRDYRITKPQTMSRVFGPLTRYKLYDNLDNNTNWEIDFDSPRKEVWTYVCHKYNEVQVAYNIDFMRGDMSHVQMRPTGVPEVADAYYDIHKAIKNYVQLDKPYFAYFAESFLAKPNEMGYGDEIAHLEKSDADSTLGDLQSMVVGTPKFMSEFSKYHRILRTSSFAPNFTIMTADKDDPRFDEFYVKGNELRLFCGLFLTDMPSYMGLGFEIRDTHLTPAPNEHYTKLYVFQINEGTKATRGPYVWGINGELFHQLTRIRLFAEKILPQIQDMPIQWLSAPDEEGKEILIAWKIDTYLFIANFDLEHPHSIAAIFAPEEAQFLFSTVREDEFSSLLAPGEGRVYEWI